MTRMVFDHGKLTVFDDSGIDITEMFGADWNLLMVSGRPPVLTAMVPLERVSLSGMTVEWRIKHPLYGAAVGVVAMELADGTRIKFDAEGTAYPKPAE